jgi:hypothetical protein
VLAAMAVSTALFAPAALADNSDDTLICQLLLLGQPGHDWKGFSHGRGPSIAPTLFTTGP